MDHSRKHSNIEKKLQVSLKDPHTSETEKNIQTFSGIQAKGRMEEDQKMASFSPGSGYAKAAFIRILPAPLLQKELKSLIV